MLTGSLINAGAILLGSGAGLLLRHFSHRGPSSASQRIRERVMQGLALCILCIGISGCLKGKNMLIMILSMVLGTLLGELLDLDHWMQALGDWTQKQASRLFPAAPGGPTISEGFVAASLLFCVGAMSIVGALENGLTGSIETLQAKALLDGISSVVFSSTLGFGVALSAVAVLLYEGSISLLASLVAPLLSEAVIAEMTAIGSLLIIALALNMLEITKIR